MIDQEEVEAHSGTSERLFGVGRADVPVARIFRAGNEDAAAEESLYVRNDGYCYSFRSPETLPSIKHRGIEAEEDTLSAAAKVLPPSLVLKPVHFKKRGNSKERFDGLILGDTIAAVLQVKSRAPLNGWSENEASRLASKAESAMGQANGAVRKMALDGLVISENMAGTQTVFDPSGVSFIKVAILESDIPDMALFNGINVVAADDEVVLTRNEWHQMLSLYPSATSLVQALYRAAGDQGELSSLGAVVERSLSLESETDSAQVTETHNSGLSVTSSPFLWSDAEKAWSKVTIRLARHLSLAAVHPGGEELMQGVVMFLDGLPLRVREMADEILDGFDSGSDSKPRVGNMAFGDTSYVFGRYPHFVSQSDAKAQIVNGINNIDSLMVAEGIEAPTRSFGIIMCQAESGTGWQMWSSQRKP